MSLYKKIETRPIHPQPQPQPQELLRLKASPKSPQLFSYATDGTVNREGKVRINYCKKGIYCLYAGEIDSVLAAFARVCVCLQKRKNC